MFQPPVISLHVITQTFDTNHFMSSHTTYLSNLVAVCQIAKSNKWYVYTYTNLPPPSLILILIFTSVISKHIINIFKTVTYQHLSQFSL